MNKNIKKLSLKVLDYGENISLFILVIFLGIMAGFFWTYSFSVNYATLQLDGEMYAVVQSLFNITVRNPIFFTFFFGAGIMSIVTLLTNIKRYKTIQFLLLLLIALVYIGGVIIYTKNVNLPLNHYTESWNPTSLPGDWAQVRKDWNLANLIRVYTSFIAFFLALFVLLLRSINIKK